MGRPGSFLWLLGHEMRLGWRGGFLLRGGRRPKASLIITVVFVLAVGGFGGVPIGLALRGHSLMEFSAFAPIADLALLTVFTLMLSQTLIGAVSLLYERADFDLLLSSPIKPSRVLAVRSLTMAFNAALIFCVLLTPMLVPIAVLGHPDWLMAYGVIAALSLAAAGVGLSTAIGLFALIGPKRTKVVGQVLGAVVGAAFFFFSQIRSILGGKQADSLWNEVVGRAIQGGLDLPEPLTWPARALLGEPLPAAMILGVAAMIFALSVGALGRRFSDDASAAYGSDSRKASVSASTRGRFGASAFGATVTKELRLILRDPGLISQVLLRVLYMIPLVFVVLRTAGDKQELAVASAAGGLAFMAGQVAGSLSWITVSAEDAPELLAASPAPMRLIWRAKVTGALLPLAILLAIPLGVLAWLRPWAALYAALGCLGSAYCAAWINVWMQKPGSRRDFRRRRDAALVATIAELIVGAFWGGAVGLAVAGLAWALIPLALAILCTLLLRRSEESVMRRLAEASTA